MALTNFEFPKVTLEQEYASGTIATTRVLGVACVGPRYLLHEAGTSTMIPQGTTAYDPTAGLLVAELPGHVASAVPDTANTDTQRLVVKDGIFSYFTEDTAANFTVDGSSITFPNYNVRSGNGATGSSNFGTRGVSVGDPIIIDTGEDKVMATVLAIGSSVAGGGYNKIIVGSGFAGALAEATALIFCEKFDTVYAPSASTFTITSSTNAQGITTYGLTIYGGLDAELPDNLDKSTSEPIEAELESGVFYIEYRERTAAGVNALGTLTSLTDIEATLGKPCKDNPLALACYFAMRGGSNSTTYFTVVAEDTASAYNKALDYLAKFNEIYSIVPCTTDEAVVQACVASCIGYSNDINSKIRRACWYGIDTPAELNLWSGTGTFATADNVVTVTLSEDAFIDNPMQEGDVLRLDASPYTEYAIVTTNGVNVAQLPAGTTATGTNVAMTLVRKSPNTSDLIENLIAQRQVRSTSERAVCVWGDDVEYNSEIVSNYALAAAAAGMRAYEPCQRPLSNLGYGFFSLKNTNGFSLSELTRLGSNGIWIVADNTDGLPVNKRQITTAVANNLLLDEESIISNADTIALNLCRMGEGYVGNSNITPILLSILEQNLTAYLETCLVNDTGSLLIGPQLLSYSIVRIWQDPVNLDHIYAEVEVEPPRPFNRFHIMMRVI